MINLIHFKGREYPKFQAEGNAAQFAIPFAKQVCKGKGYDVGCGKLEWLLPEAIPIDPSINKYDAMNLPEKNVDYIFSSHLLEHLPNWVVVMDYWYDTLRCGGTLFLYLPDFSQTYWRPWNNRKHIHIFKPKIIEAYMRDKEYKNIFVSNVDLNNSFMAMGEK